MGKKATTSKAPAGKGKENLTARVDAEFKKRVGRYSVDYDIDIQDMIKDALDEYMKKKGA